MALIALLANVISFLFLDVIHCLLVEENMYCVTVLLLDRSSNVMQSVSPILCQLCLIRFSKVYMMIHANL